jgi:hypothetical protein
MKNIITFNLVRMGLAKAHGNGIFRSATFRVSFTLLNDEDLRVYHTDLVKSLRDQPWANCGNDQDSSVEGAESLVSAGKITKRPMNKRKATESMKMRQDHLKSISNDFTFTVKCVILAVISTQVCVIVNVCVILTFIGMHFHYRWVCVVFKLFVIVAVIIDLVIISVSVCTIEGYNGTCEGVYRLV